MSVRAHSVRDGSVTWIDPLTLGGAKPPRRLDFHFYSGISGIALFLAAAGRYLEGGDEAKDLARRAMQPLRAQLRRLTDSPERAAQLKIALGGVNGLGSYVYALARLGAFLEDDAFLEEAVAVAELITPERVAGDRNLDVFAGSAGALLAVLALDRLVGASETSLLDIALACGEHLVAEALPQDGGDVGAVAWPANGKRPWCGWSHGASGIAHALARLAERCGRDHFLTTARAGLAFERMHFDAEARNWRDLRFEDEVNFISAVCHGAPGIALARLGLPDAAKSPEVSRELQQALLTTAEAEPAEMDHVCCGDMGRAEVLFEAARHGELDMLAAASDICHRTLRRAGDHQGAFRYFDEPHHERFSPSFFSGAAGIGYAFLRMSSEADLPCLLRFE